VLYETPSGMLAAIQFRAFRFAALSLKTKEAK
jgi:hypothetical protein